MPDIFTPKEPRPTSGAAASSREALSAGKFKTLFAKKTADMESPDRSEAAIKAMLEANARVLVPGTSIDLVVKQLKDEGFIMEPEKPKPIEGVVMYKADYAKHRIVEDEALQKILEENKFSEAIEKDLFRNEADLDTIYQRSLALGRGDQQETVEKEEYYYEFAHLVKGGIEEIKKDLEDLNKAKELFKKKAEALDPGRMKKNERAKKLATIVERAIVYSVTTLGWYDRSMTIEPAAQFDDVKRGVDDVLQIQKEDESSFMGLGIDVTYRGLLSEQFREKFDHLLTSISEGHRTKIKYFKNHAGEPMKEFSVPKVILFFDMKDVKDLVHMVKNVDNPEIMKEFKKSSQKVRVMSQMIIQCELLAQFSKEYRNPLFKMYQDMATQIKEISRDSLEVKSSLDAKEDDGVTKHLKYLIEQFTLKNIKPNQP